MKAGLGLGVPDQAQTVDLLEDGLGENGERDRKNSIFGELVNADFLPL
jgi:hypothetical protein